jgi:hypothetical protein
MAVMDIASETPDAGKRLWKSFELAHLDLEHDRLAVGRLGLELRNLYSERSNSADRRRSSGHGSLEAELRKRGYKPNRIREAVRDYRVSIGELPPSESTKAKRAARSKPSTDWHRGFSAGLHAQQHTAGHDTELLAFARLLTYAEAKTVFRTMAMRLHPDHGGDAEAMQRLNSIWERLELFFIAKESQSQPFGNDSSQGNTHYVV